MRYDRNGAGAGAGTHALGSARVLQVATGGFGGFPGAFFLGGPFLGGGFPDRFTDWGRGTEEIAGRTTGGRCSTGNFICTAISSVDKHKRPQCSIMYPETCVIQPRLLSCGGCSPSHCQTQLHWSFACMQVSSWNMQ